MNPPKDVKDSLKRLSKHIESIEDIYVINEEILKFFSEDASMKKYLIYQQRFLKRVKYCKIFKCHGVCVKNSIWLDDTNLYTSGFIYIPKNIIYRGKCNYCCAAYKNQLKAPLSNPWVNFGPKNNTDTIYKVYKVSDISQSNIWSWNSFTIDPDSIKRAIQNQT